MTIYMLDTDICSYIIRDFSDHLVRRYRDAMQGIGNDVVVSVITVSELLFGTELHTKHRAPVQAFLEQMEIEKWDEAAAAHCAHIRAELKRTGRPIDIFDIQIAAHARSIGAKIVTNNLKHFEHIPGLLVENWLE